MVEALNHSELISHVRTTSTVMLPSTLADKWEQLSVTTGLTLAIASLAVSATPRLPAAVCAAQTLALIGIAVNLTATAFVTLGAAHNQRPAINVVQRVLLVMGAALPILALGALFVGTQPLVAVAAVGVVVFVLGVTGVVIMYMHGDRA